MAIIFVRGMIKVVMRTTQGHRILAFIPPFTGNINCMVSVIRFVQINRFATTTFYTETSVEVIFCQITADSLPSASNQHYLGPNHFGPVLQSSEKDNPTMSPEF